jgi:hypothetical protein
MTAFSQLKNEGIVGSEGFDFSKTKTIRLASEKTGADLFRQVYDVTFVRKSGGTIEVLAVSDASREECSMGNVRVYVVSRVLK